MNWVRWFIVYQINNEHLITIALTQKEYYDQQKKRILQSAMVRIILGL